MDSSNEIWIPIPDFDGYTISNFGRIKNSRGMLMAGAKLYKRGKPWRHIVGLTSNGKATTKFVHRLMMVFLPTKPSTAHTIDHIDRNPFNNHIDNLRWATQKEQIDNRANYRKVGKYLKLSMDDLNTIVLRNKKETFSEISKDYGIRKNDLVILLKHMHPEY